MQIEYRYPGEKDRANTWLARALVGTTRISAEIREILTVQRPVTRVQAVQKLTTIAFRRSSKLVAGDTQGR